MTEERPVAAPPATEHEAIDAALAALVDLDEAPVGDHHARLAQAHETLHQVLDEATRPRS